MSPSIGLGLSTHLARRFAVSDRAGAAAWSPGSNQPPEGTARCSGSYGPSFSSPHLQPHLLIQLLPASFTLSPQVPVHSPLTLPHLPQIQLLHPCLPPTLLLLLLLLCCVDAGEAGATAGEVARPAPAVWGTAGSAAGGPACMGRPQARTSYIGL